MNPKSIKENILEHWIMIEKLSEGNWNKKDYCEIKLDKQNDNYYDYFNTILKQETKQKKEKYLVFIFNTFNSKELIDLLNKKHNTKINDDELESIGNNKFSFAIRFNNNLEIEKQSTFYTWSAYIRETKSDLEFNSMSKFKEKEHELSDDIENIFKKKETKDLKAFFNKAFQKLIQNYNIDVNLSRYKIVNDDEDDALLHSFFIDDLVEAKGISTQNLDKYLSSSKEENSNELIKINLDNKQADGIKQIKEILDPKNYPCSRFPSNVEYALSLMQQIAVNLSTSKNYENIKMKSVNGPPGTGKTTLLKDIFAELITQQSLEICKLDSKIIKDVFYKEIKILPTQIANKSILIASSNNGAVQNIVNELLLLENVDKDLANEIKNADYFYKTANAITEEKDNNEGISNKHKITKEKWGLFSLEGGKKKNIIEIIKAVENIIKEIYQQENNNSNVYQDFLNLYNDIKKAQNDIQMHINLLAKIELEIQTLIDDFMKDKPDDKFENRNLNIESIKNAINESLKEIINLINNNHNELKNINKSIENLKLQKPSWISKLFKTKKYKEFNEKLNSYLNQRIKICDSLLSLESKKNNISKKIDSINRMLDQKNKIEDFFINKKINKFNAINDNNLFQKSNPWFNKNFRIKQSKLFILAIKVRRQFLYENREALKSAVKIWNNKIKGKTIDKCECLVEAWNWINMAVPAISSTFASIRTMYKNFPKESMGFLFIDEAGQAVPQAAVGAIFRTKNIIAVGDPSQIEPVSVLDQNTLKWIKEKYKLPYGLNSSVQEIVDNHSKYGFYKKNGDWIGIPLWVHRRCLSPMFDISNEISYEGNMVQGKENGKQKSHNGFWLHVKGKAINKHYVKEQYQVLKKYLVKIKNRDANLKDVFIISPFKAIVKELERNLNDIINKRNIGTVHTFQGKEAKIVFLVLGCDKDSINSAQWAVGSNNPNIMNVAVTRAKEELYIIGDKEVYESLNSDVIKACLKHLEIVNEQ
ncbi:DEAD/DEAH box helicase [Mycoplasma sp. 2261]